MCFARVRECVEFLNKKQDKIKHYKTNTNTIYTLIKFHSLPYDALNTRNWKRFCQYIKILFYKEKIWNAQKYENTEEKTKIINKKKIKNKKKEVG